MRPESASSNWVRLRRPIFFSLGLTFVALGYVGYLVPGMPGTVFFLLALWAFKRSSPRLEHWLLHKSVVSPILLDWERDRSIRRGTKRFAIGVLWLSMILSSAVLWSRPAGQWAIPVMLACAVGVSVYLWTRKTKAE